MPDEAQSLYDQLAACYHLIFENWDASIARQAAILGAILERECGTPGEVRILDCACGIGTQSLGLAAHRFRVTCCDFSRASLERVREEAAERRLSLRVFMADMRDLSVIPEKDFDAVICMDNALPHFENDEQILKALLEMRSKLARNKLLMLSIRDYDRLLQERPAVQEPMFYRDHGKRRIVHQVWDWIDERRYSFHLYITRETDGGWESQHYTCTYRAVLRDDLSRLLEAAGFTKVQWLLPAESGFYQPILLANAR